MGKSSLDDKLIDLCIALESVFQSQTEISFQFALYNALLGEEDVNKRADTFRLLKQLYAERSNIVHGNKEFDRLWVEDNWPALTRIARTSILKKIEFLADKSHNEWKLRLQSLALGAV